MATTIDAAMLLAAFQRSNFDFGGDNELANEAVSLCSRFSKNPNQLADEYDALIMTKKLQNADTLNKALLERLRTELTKKEKKEENEISVKSLITKDVSKTETSSISKTSNGSLEKSVLDKIKSN